MLFKYPVVDSHIHMYSEEDLAEIEKGVLAGGYEQYTLLSSSFLAQTAAGNLAIAWAKAKHTKQIYGYASFHTPSAGAPDADNLLQQAKVYREIGFDGIKMIQGKPTIRKALAVPLDDPCFDPMFSYLEETGMPLLYHSNDPAEFWDEEHIPQWARKADFLYDETYPSKRQITDETIGILKKHPRLNMTIAHFFFLPNTDEYSLACELMEAYPSFFLDLTPGWEMFGDFEKSKNKWGSFIKKYANRITYGTDISGKNWRTVLEPLRKCLEESTAFQHEEYACFGLGLDDETLRFIYRDTYKSRVQPNNPKTINPEGCITYLKTVHDWINSYQGIDKAKARADSDKYLALLLQQNKAYQ